MFPFFSLLLAFYITAVLVPLTTRLARHLGVVDSPDGDRKVHATPIPRTGGIALAGGVLAPVWLWLPMTPHFKAFFTGAAIILLFGLLDDLFQMSYRKKLLGQSLGVAVTMAFGKFYVSSLGVWAGGELLIPVWIGIPLTFFFLIGVTNAINLADGLDGLAGGLCILVFGGIGILAHGQGATDIVTACLIIIGAILGFLRYNTYPATVFMGDAGAQLLGFSAGVLSLYLTQAEATPLSRTLPILLIGFPILDTLSVMAERFSEGQSIFTADNRHFHHRLLRLGASPVASVVYIYLIQGVMVFLAIRFRYYPEDWILVAYAATALPAVLLLWVFTRFGSRLTFLRRSEGTSRSPGKRSRILELAREWSLHTIMVLLSAGLLWLTLTCTPCFYGDWEPYLFWAVGALAIVVYWLRRSNFLQLIRFCIYMLVLYLLITTRGMTIAFLPIPVRTFNVVFWGSLFVLLAMYLVFTRFKDMEATTLDYLLLLAVALIPFVPVEQVREYGVGTIAGAMIVVLWTTEVLLRNTKRNLNTLTVSCLVCLLVLGGRSFLQ